MPLFGIAIEIAAAIAAARCSNNTRTTKWSKNKFVIRKEKERMILKHTVAAYYQIRPFTEKCTRYICTKKIATMSCHDVSTYFTGFLAVYMGRSSVEWRTFVHGSLACLFLCNRGNVNYALRVCNSGARDETGAELMSSSSLLSSLP